MRYEGQCGSCLNFEDGSSSGLYDSTNANYVKGYCTWYGTYYYPDESCNSHFQPRYSPSSNCYLTTILCHRLGLEDNCEELETLRNFRKKVLQKDEQFKSLLYEYDAVGPVISKKLEKEDMIIVRGLYLSYIKPAVSLLKEGNQKEAIERYTEMTKLLKSFYQIEVDKKIPEDYDYSHGGHGRFVKIRK